MNAKAKLEILLVEDSPDDVVIVSEVLAGTKIKYNLNVPQDGAEALAFLHKEGKYAGSPRPDLILLDLNLPKIDGREVLARIKADDGLKQIPVIVMSSSDQAKDVNRAYELHANCYIEKPSNLSQLIKVGKVIENWLGVIRLPDRKPDFRNENSNN